MASKNQQYPCYLNPFGSDDEQDEQQDPSGHAIKSKDPRRGVDYPKYLSPFGEDEEEEEENSEKIPQEDYDNSLNPFGSEESDQEIVSKQPQQVGEVTKSITQDDDDGNPFGPDDEDSLEDVKDPEEDKIKTNSNEETKQASLQDIAKGSSDSPIETPQASSPQPESLEPPKPLPRTKSLLKKEQALKNKQNHIRPPPPPLPQSPPETSDHTLNLNIQSSTIDVKTNNAAPIKKRNAPPVPINFKRQVSGSMVDIEKELDDIGDKLAIIEKESNLCQESLKATYQVDEVEFARSRSKYIELIKRKNSIVRRQKELMYRKRELKLDQIYSDIEYELRMIGNKQLSHRTSDDETREKELLKKLVEIVEEKNDIVENLNRDSSSDNQDIEEAFRRLNINYSSDKLECNVNADSKSVKSKKENCDKTNSQATTTGIKFTKFATLLPKGGTIKGTIKMKRKRLFKKSDSHSVEK